MHTPAKLLFLFFFLSAAGFATVGHHEPGITNFDQVSPTLYRGGQPSDRGVKTLTALHVKTVINLRDDASPAEAAREEAAVRAAGMTYIALPQDADTVTLADARNFLARLANAPAPVFVHCYAGRDRTGLAIAAYRLHIDHWTEQAALSELYNHGHYWLLYPKVRAVVEALAKLETPAAAAVVLSATPPVKTKS